MLKKGGSKSELETDLASVVTILDLLQMFKYTPMIFVLIINGFPYNYLDSIFVWFWVMVYSKISLTLSDIWLKFPALAVAPVKSNKSSLW